MKKCLAIIITIIIMLSNTAFANEKNSEFTFISIPCPDGQKLFENDYTSFSHLLARYADDKTPIPLSCFYDGCMYATIPSENADRQIEAFISEEIKFTDDDDSYEVYIMSALSATGIIKGDDMGRALPLDSVTRAEATAMVMRMIGVEANTDTDSGFKDVDKDDWYSGVIKAARSCGIAEGDTDSLFSPERNVSREEIIVMTARALQYTGLAKENKNGSKDELSAKISAADTNAVSDWAVSSYEIIGDLGLSDYIETNELDAEGFPISEQRLNPQQAAKRFEVANVLFRAINGFQLYPSQTAIKYGFDKAMPVIDGSTSTYPFTEAVYDALFYNGYKHSDKPEKHSKSHVSYQRLINGEVDMIFASVYPAQDILEMAKKNGVELELIPIAYDAMIFFTNADNPSEGLTKEQISDIYVNNAYENWNQVGGADALLYPYCRNNDSGSHAQMERHFLNGNEINEKIRNETTSVSMSNVLTDVMDAQTDNPVGYGLGYSIYYYFKNMDLFYETNTYLKLLNIDGVAPTDETIADGSYPLSNNTYIVIRSDEPQDSPARKMAEFMLTEQGQQCVSNAGFGRLK